jgi:hypothetical protein
MLHAATFRSLSLGQRYTPLRTRLCSSIAQSFDSRESVSSQLESLKLESPKLELRKWQVEVLPIIEEAIIMKKWGVVSAATGKGLRYTHSLSLSFPLTHSITH